MEQITNTKNKINATVATLSALALGAGVFFGGHRSSGEPQTRVPETTRVYGPHPPVEGPIPTPPDPNTTPAGVSDQLRGTVSIQEAGAGSGYGPAGQTPTESGFLPHEAGQPPDDTGFLPHEERPQLPN